MSLFREPANKAMQGHAEQRPHTLLAWSPRRDEKSGFIQQAIEQDDLKGAK